MTQTPTMPKRRRTLFPILALATSLCLFPSQSEAQKPRTFILGANKLMEVRANADDPDYLYAGELKALYQKADSIIETGKVYSVTWSDDIPPSGDIHDYYSLSPYWWPDPSKPDGLPYIRHDGKTNPERDKVSDRKPCESMIEDVGVLARAYFFSSQEKYAAFASTLLKAWFLDEATKMNPNINHGQVRKGHNLGFKGGIIGTRRFCLLLDSVALIESSESWKEKDQKALQQWMGEFTQWLLTHEFGIAERSSKNNHGTSYDMQVISLALFAERDDLVRSTINNYTRNRIHTQIKPDGAQPEELARTKGWNYCIENIKYFFRIARMVQHLDIDLYTEREEDEGGLRDAINFLLPYTTKENNWPYQQITAWQPERFSETLHVAYAVYKDEKMKEAIERMGWNPPTLEDYINLPD